MRQLGARGRWDLRVIGCNSSWVVVLSYSNRVSHVGYVINQSMSGCYAVGAGELGAACSRVIERFTGNATPWLEA